MSRAHFSAALRAQIRKDSRARCGYCHAPEAFLGMPLDVEHLIPGKTAVGRATVDGLRLNNDFIVMARRFWVEAGRWPPEDGV